MTPLTTRARELAARERKLYDQRTIPAVLEELADEVERLTELNAQEAEFLGTVTAALHRIELQADKLRAEAANSAAQRDEAVLRAQVAEERLRAVEARLSAESEAHGYAVTALINAHAYYRAELARIRNTTTKERAI